eukprot:8503023-Pyramimonas_sp.AAC.1
MIALNCASFFAAYTRNDRAARGTHKILIAVRLKRVLAGQKQVRKRKLRDPVTGHRRPGGAGQI